MDETKQINKYLYINDNIDIIKKELKQYNITLTKHTKNKLLQIKKLIKHNKINNDNIQSINKNITDIKIIIYMAIIDTPTSDDENEIL